MVSLLYSRHKLCFAVILAFCIVWHSHASNPLTITMHNTSNLCNGDSTGTARVFSVANGTAPYTYYWQPGGQTTQTITGLSAGTYTVTVTDANGHTGTDTAFIYQPPPILVSFNADTVSSCGQVCTNFYDETYDYTFGIVKWNWSFGDGGTSTEQNPRYCYVNPGQYNVTLTVTNNNGCKQHLTIYDMINVYSYPQAAFAINPQPATIATPGIQFTDETTDAYGINSWQWNFYDSTQFSTQQNPYVVFKDTGSYCVKLKVTDIHGCSDSAINCLDITPPDDIWIPEAFSPNGDGQNDILYVRCNCIKTMFFEIYDRWGNKVFESENENTGWDGTYNGKPQGGGTYMYYIKATLYNNTIVEHKGNIELVR